MTPISEIVCHIMHRIDVAFFKRCIHFTGHEAFDGFLFLKECEDVLLVTGRQGVGKTALMLSIAYNNLKDTKQKIYYVSGNEKSEALTLRLISMLTGWPVSKIVEADFFDDEWAQLTKALNTVSAWPLYFEDINRFSLGEWCDSVVGGDHHSVMLIVDDLDYRFLNDDLLSFIVTLKHAASMSGVRIVCGFGDICLGTDEDETVSQEILSVANANRLILAELTTDPEQERTVCTVSSLRKSERQYKRLLLDCHT